MDTLKQVIFDIDCLCPLLAIMKREGRINDYANSIIAMNKAYKENGGDATLDLHRNALEYLKSLERGKNG